MDSCSVVSTQILIPWPTNPMNRALITTVGGRNGSPRVTWATPAPTSSSVTHRGLPIRRTAHGVTAAASRVPQAPAATTSPSPTRPPGKSVPSAAKVLRYSNSVIRVRTP
jgi:hypothetical protein